MLKRSGTTVATRLRTKVQVNMDSSGRITSAVVLKSFGDAQRDARAVTEIKAMTFKPARIGSKASGSTLDVNYDFKD